MNATRPKAYSYLRFSTPEQMQGDSFRRQTQLADEYARAHGLELDEALTFQDLGVSAFRGRNAKTGALRAFLDAAEEGLIPDGSVLLVESLDRISREQILAAQGLFLQIIQAGITLVTLSDRRSYSRETINANPTDLIISLVTMMRAHDESAAKARRLKAAWEAKRARGHSKPLTARAPFWLKMNKATGAFEVVNDRADVVRRIYQETLNGVGQHAIAQRLNKEGVPTFGNAALWHRSYVAKILANPAVMGRMIPHKLEYKDGKKIRIALDPIDGYFPAVVTEEVFTRVQSLRTGARGPSVRSASGVLQNLLGGLAICPRCSGSMTRVTKGTGRENAYLVCSRAKAGGPCKYRAVRQKYVERALIENASFLASSAPSGQPDLDSMLENLDGAMNATENEIENVLDAISRASSPALATKLRRLEDELEIMKQKERDLLHQHASASGPVLKKKLDELRSELMHHATSSKQRPNALLRQLLNHVVVDYRSGKLRLDWKQGGQTELSFAWPEDDEADEDVGQLQRV